MMTGIKDGKILFYTAPIRDGFRMRVDTSFANDRDLDKAWESVLLGLEENRDQGRWQWKILPSSLLAEIRMYFEGNSIYDIMRLGNEAVFLKFERVTRCATTVVRPAFSVRELIPREFWSIELVDKDLLEWVAP